MNENSRWIDHRTRRRRRAIACPQAAERRRKRARIVSAPTGSIRTPRSIGSAPRQQGVSRRAREPSGKAERLPLAPLVRSIRSATIRRRQDQASVGGATGPSGTLQARTANRSDASRLVCSALVSKQQRDFGRLSRSPNLERLAARSARPLSSARHVASRDRVGDKALARQLAARPAASTRKQRRSPHRATAQSASWRRCRGRPRRVFSDVSRGPGSRRKQGAHGARGLQGTCLSCCASLATARTAPTSSKPFTGGSRTARKLL